MIDSIADGRLLTRAEVADLMQIPVKTLARWASRGEGPPYLKVGRHTRYDAGDLRRWLDGQRRAQDGR